MVIGYNQLKIGADPELFIHKVSEDGKFTPVSAHDIIPGNKYNPFPVKTGAVQVDGTAAEFNIDPAPTRFMFVRNMRNVLGVLDFMIKAKDEGLIALATPTAIYSREYFDKLPDECKMLGCDPDIDAWSAKVKRPDASIADTKTTTFRSGGGHIHIGWSENIKGSDEFYMDCCSLAKQLDSVLYLASLNWDDDRTRRRLYGQPGSFRTKSYGMEYRTLSNAWVQDERLHGWIFDATSRATKLLFNDKKHLYTDPKIRELIHKPDVTKGELAWHKQFLQDKGFNSLPSEI